MDRHQFDKFDSNRGKLKQDICPECRGLLQVSKGVVGFCVRCGTTWVEDRRTGNFLIEPPGKKSYIMNPSGETIENPQIVNAGDMTQEDVKHE
jgi:hypothetical protein